MRGSFYVCKFIVSFTTIFCVLQLNLAFSHWCNYTDSGSLEWILKLYSLWLLTFKINWLLLPCHTQSFNFKTTYKTHSFHTQKKKNQNAGDISSFKSCKTSCLCSWFSLRNFILCGSLIFLRDCVHIFVQALKFSMQTLP